MTNWIHLCIDMQRMFAEDTPWHVPWMAAVSSEIVELAGTYPERTIFTRFVPPRTAEAMPGMWKEYYKKWEMMTLDRMPNDLVGLVPELRGFVPPARIFDKMTYSPWIDGRLHLELTRGHVDTLIVTGGETDVCVLTAVVGAVDLGYRVVVLKDAVCSGADQTHDAALELLGRRFTLQVEIRTTADFLAAAGLP